MIPWLFDHRHQPIHAMTRHARISAQLPPKQTLQQTSGSHISPIGSPSDSRTAQ
jgi:hypothetical protein